MIEELRDDVLKVESMSLEFGTRHCGMRCPYCYVRDGNARPRSDRAKREPLTVDELAGVMDQAIELGLGGVGIIGPYEPLQEQGILDLVVCLRERGLRVTIFTKGQCITEELVDCLSRNEVTLGITVHSLCSETHDELTGVDGSFQRMMEGIDTLLGNGYRRMRRRILIQSVAVRPNVADLPEVWRWARRNSFIPFFERMTAQGAARASLPALGVPPETLRELSYRISDIDRDEFGREWSPHPPWIGESCARHLNSCHLTADGYLQPCTGVDIPIGNVRDAALSTLLGNSQMMRDLRNIRETVKGACRECALCDVCYGCRGQAYQLTGDYLAADPCCWNNPKRCNGACGSPNRCHAEGGREQAASLCPSDAVPSDNQVEFDDPITTKVREGAREDICG